MSTEQLYRYGGRSALTASERGRPELRLSASGGFVAPGPKAFFAGALTRPAEAAAALLAVARVARTRYYVPPNMVAAAIGRDPVITSNGDRLRFESLSPCCGVYARFDVLPAGFDAETIGHGCTNVDVNDDLRDALAHAPESGTLRLDVDTDALTVAVGADRIVEKRVPLPRRWLKGLGEVPVAASRMDLRASLSAVEARRFLQSLPAKGTTRRPLWAVPSGATLRLAPRPVAGAVCLAGPERLAALRPLLRFASELRVYGPAQCAHAGADASAWEIVLGGGRLVLMLSPEVRRGFSGEGGVLGSAVSDEIAEDAELIASLLAWEPRIEVGALADQAGLSAERVRAGLRLLGSAGQVGYDLAEAAYFHRDLPFDVDAVRALHPRVGAARALAEAGAVTADPRDTALYQVTSGPERYLVRLPAAGLATANCTCLWWSRHHGERGPCKHVLAAELHRGVAR